MEETGCIMAASFLSLCQHQFLVSTPSLVSCFAGNHLLTPCSAADSLILDSNEDCLGLCGKIGGF